MRKTRIFLAGILIVMMFAFTGCGSDDNGNVDSGNPNGNSNATTDATDNTGGENRDNDNTTNNGTNNGTGDDLGETVDEMMTSNGAAENNQNNQ